MDIKGFEDLEVFQRAYRLALEVHRASLKFPTVEQYALADQMRRASKSICVNLAISNQNSGARSQIVRSVTLAN
jgi:four helix bundle protein